MKAFNELSKISDKADPWKSFAGVMIMLVLFLEIDQELQISKCVKF